MPGGGESGRIPRMKATTIIAAVSMLLPLVQAAVPAHFSDRAKEILADSVPVQPAEYPLNIVYFLSDTSPWKCILPHYPRIYLYMYL